MCDQSFLPRVFLPVPSVGLINRKRSNLAALDWSFCALSLQICPLVNNALSDVNPRLKTLNGETPSLGQRFFFVYSITPEELTEILPRCSFG